MALMQCISRLGGWEGYRLVSVEETQRNGDRWCVIRLAPLQRRRSRCSGCGRAVRGVHDEVERRVRDLPLFAAQVELIVPRRRLACAHCGPRLEALSWLASYARVTARLAANVARLCQVTSVRHAAAFFDLNWKTVKAIDKAAMEHALGPIDLSGVEVIGLDEFAIQKGHRYATVVVDPTCKRVLWVGRGRGREDVRPFFELLGAGCARIKAAVMDMSAAFAQEVRAQCPQAQIVYDLFHVVAKYSREVIDRVRVDAANRVRDDRPRRKVIKTARWLLLRNPSSLSGDEPARLQELLAANRSLLTVYLLKDELKQLWRYRRHTWARKAWKTWRQRAMRSRLEPLKRFARNLEPYLEGIFSHCRWPLGTNLIEGINNKIKVIKRVAYGFRDDAYFFLKIRAAFPGNG